MNFDDCEQVYEATISLMKNEKEDVFSYYIKNDIVRAYVSSMLRNIGFNVINANSRRHIYVDMKR